MHDMSLTSEGTGSRDGDSLNLIRLNAHLHAEDNLYPHTAASSTCHSRSLPSSPGLRPRTALRGSGRVSSAVARRNNLEFRTSEGSPVVSNTLRNPAGKQTRESRETTSPHDEPNLISNNQNASLTVKTLRRPPSRSTRRIATRRPVRVKEARARVDGGIAV